MNDALYFLFVGFFISILAVESACFKGKHTLIFLPPVKVDRLWVGLFGCLIILSSLGFKYLEWLGWP